MYKCQLCGQTSEPRQPAHKVVIETRPVRYSLRKKEITRLTYGSDEPKKYKTIDKGGIGRECVREVTVCAVCFERWNVYRN